MEFTTVTDNNLRTLFNQRSEIDTCLRFAKPMLAFSECDGRIHCGWNSTPNGYGGARTGRIISNTPNLQGAPKSLRTFIIPEAGGLLLDRDFTQQELRILAGYEDGEAKAQYLADPSTDFHSMTSARASMVLGRELPRNIAKIVVFSTLYGAGIPLLSAQLACSPEEARSIRNAVFRALPGVAALKRRMESASQFTTWGGRIYRVEAPRLIKGALQSFEYLSLNTLIQGSAADFTKTAVISGVDAGLDLRFTIHDELIVWTEPGAKCKRDMELLRQSMEDIEFSIPMLSDAYWSVQNFGALREYQHYPESMKDQGSHNE